MRVVLLLRLQPAVQRPAAAGGHALAVLSMAFLQLPQELLLILEDHWRRNKDMQGVPIYQASGLATKALSVYQAYIGMMNEDIRTAFDQVRPASLLSCSHCLMGRPPVQWPLGPQLIRV